MTTSNNDFLSSIVAPQHNHSDILVMGVGGAGGNAVSHMFDLGIKGVTYMVCNTDKPALEKNRIEKKILIGDGRGAGNKPDVGKKLALEGLNDITTALDESKAKMIFITAGMGGGTGTGAAPVIAKAAKSRGLLTVGIVTLPFKSEGPVRVGQAEKGLEEMKANTDSIVVIHNDNIAKIYGKLPITEAFRKGDDVLAKAAKGIAEMITRTDFINVDLEDARTTMTDSGMAIMGSSRKSGEEKIDQAIEEALSSPLLNQQDIRGARKILVNLSYDAENPITFEEAVRVPDLIQKRASLSAGGSEANIIWGAGPSEELKDGEVELTIVATSFEPSAVRKESSAGDNGTGVAHSYDEEEIAVEWNIVDHYSNIDDIIKQPAYLRRGMQLMGSTVKGAKRNIMEEEAPAKEKKKAAPTPEENTLF